MKRSVLILTLALTVIVLLTILIIENPPVLETKGSIIAAGRFHTIPQDEETKTREPLSDAQQKLATFMAQAEKYWRDGALEQAEASLKSALTCAPDNAAVYGQLGQVVFVQDRFDEACNYYTHYLRLNPYRIDAYTNLAIACLCAGRLEEAETLTRKGSELLHNKHPGPLELIRAAVFCKKGRDAEANECLLRAHKDMGTKVLQFMDAEWFQPLKSLPAYAQIKQEKP